MAVITQLVSTVARPSPPRRGRPRPAEYALILALIAIVAIIALIFLGSRSSTILDEGRHVHLRTSRRWAAPPVRPSVLTTLHH